jgi:hypothetical protein
MRRSYDDHGYLFWQWPSFGRLIVIASGIMHVPAFSTAFTSAVYPEKTNFCGKHLLNYFFVSSFDPPGYLVIHLELRYSLGPQLILLRPSIPPLPI